MRRHIRLPSDGARRQIARELRSQGVLDALGVCSILDFGCGYGADVQFYRNCKYDADGFDMESSFGWTEVKNRQYDLVTLVFVVNVLPTSEDRLNVVREAARYVRPGGYLLVAARSERVIASEARKGKWLRFNDGWISSPEKGTFQHGVSTEEIAWLLGAIGFHLTQQNFRLSSDVSCLMGRRS
jgi:SAM-dependent methyltransferase